MSRTTVHFENGTSILMDTKQLKPVVTEQKIKLPNGMATVHMAECPKCGYPWATRVKRPKKCPRCFKRLNHA